MQQQENEIEITRDEIKREFQLERMVLFSDAVFAIVITLMAIEIKFPEDVKLNQHNLLHELQHLVPVLLAYLVSFVFIGSIWYQHLKIFSLLKDYDKGLVVHNLMLLFFIGLFPFTASLITKAKDSMLSFFLYMGIILVCIFMQYLLYNYILVKRPSIRLNADLEEHTTELYKRKVSLIGFSAAFILITITYFVIPNPELKSLATLWMVLFPVVYRSLTKKKKNKAAQVTAEQ